MAVRGPRYSKEEFARRGHELYDRLVLPTLRPEDNSKFVAIDIETGEFEIDADDHAAVMRLWNRLPDPQPWLLRVGEPAAHRLGFRALPGRPG